MHLQDADHWERKAAQARDVASKMSGAHAKSVMLELVEHYEMLAGHARIIATMLLSAEDNAS